LYQQMGFLDRRFFGDTPDRVCSQASGDVPDLATDGGVGCRALSAGSGPVAGAGWLSQSAASWWAGGAAGVVEGEQYAGGQGQ